MCFSAEASFTMGTALSVIGVLCIREASKKDWGNCGLTMIAMIPLLFGLQQFAEGVVWLHMNGVLHETFLSRAAQMLFLSLAWLLWPVYVPVAFYLVEKSSLKKVIYAFVFVIGLIIFFIDARFLWNETVRATLVGNSLYYPASPYYGNFLYGLATILPIVISSIRKMWVFGLFLLLSYFATEAIWHFTFTSVWCFFAAISSLVLLWVLRTCSRN